MKFISDFFRPERQEMWIVVNYVCFLMPAAFLPCILENPFILIADNGFMDIPPCYSVVCFINPFSSMTVLKMGTGHERNKNYPGTSPCFDTCVE